MKDVRLHTIDIFCINALTIVQPKANGVGIFKVLHLQFSQQTFPLCAFPVWFLLICSRGIETLKRHTNKLSYTIASNRTTEASLWLYTKRLYKLLKESLNSQYGQEEKLLHLHLNSFVGKASTNNQKHFNVNWSKRSATILGFLTGQVKKVKLF